MSKLLTWRKLALVAMAFLLLGANIVWLLHPASLEPHVVVHDHNETLYRAEPALQPVMGGRDDPGRLYFAPTAAGSLPVASYNRVPVPRPRTPLFIGFTQNNNMLVQTVLSYLAVGWPPEDIIVIDNSGTMDANSRGRLTPSNPFHLDYAWLRSTGVAVLQTPTLLNFSQLQNFYLRTSMAQNWRTFFWSHMDVVALGDENSGNFKPFYHGILDIVERFGDKDDWALKWLSYDALTFVNTDGWAKIGNWDVFIPYYYADCDAYSRMVLTGFSRAEADEHVGIIFDVADTLADPEQQLFPMQGEQGPNSTRYQRLRQVLQGMEKKKQENPAGRNTWQDQSRGGKGELWTPEPKGFHYSWQRISEKGKEVYRNKWGSDECNLDAHGVRLEAAWKNVY